MVCFVISPPSVCCTDPPLLVDDQSFQQGDSLLLAKFRQAYCSVVPRPILCCTCISVSLGIHRATHLQLEHCSLAHPSGWLFTALIGQAHSLLHEDVRPGVSHFRARPPKAVVVGVRSSVPMEERPLSELSSGTGAATDIWEKRRSAPRAAERMMDWRGSCQPASK